MIEITPGNKCFPGVIFCEQKIIGKYLKILYNENNR